MWQHWVRGSLLAISAIFASFLVYLLLTRAESIPSSRLAPATDFERADARIERFTFMQTKDGAVQWEVRAQKARLFEGENRAVLDRVHITLYGDRGREFSLEGDEGTLDTVKKNFVLSNRTDPIAVHTESGYTIYTNHLAWNEERGEITTAEPVTITGHGLHVNGRGLIGKVQSEEFQVLEDVHVEIHRAD
jgi:lipopolysaccharide export system protein LptC